MRKDGEIHFILYIYVIKAQYVCTRSSKSLLPTFASVKVNLYGGVSARIKDLSGVDLDNRHVVGP